VFAAIEKLTEQQKQQLKEWMAEQNLPAVKKMVVPQLEAVIGWLMDLPDEGET
jgi:Spy/CpxP family protein refolding chaperone